MSHLPEDRPLGTDAYSLILRLRASIVRHPIVTIAIVVVIAASTLQPEWTITPWLLRPLVLAAVIAAIWIALKRRRARGGA
jgi:protein-S-isoprenylcysteine O-methyltransferase Ste14